MEYYTIYTLISGVFILSVCSTSSSNCTLEDAATLKCNSIPAYIPSGVSRVRIVDVGYSNGDLVNITRANFSSSSWNQVTFLEITGLPNSYSTVHINDRCFGELVILSELHMHCHSLVLSANVFLGLSSVTTLDVSNCVRLSQNSLLKTLNESNKLPGLRRLVLSNFNTAGVPFEFGEHFAETLLPRNISYIQASSMQISKLDFRAVFKTLKHLQVLDLSFSQINELDGLDATFTTDDLDHVKILNFNKASLPAKAIAGLPGKIHLYDETKNVSELWYSGHIILDHEWLILSGIIPPYASLWLYNNTLVLDMNVTWFPSNFTLSSNNLKHLDLRLQCNSFEISSIQCWDLSKNSLEFIHPQLFYCMPNLHTLYLSKNELSKMVHENSALFETLFLEINNLKEIDLSSNGLSEIPQNIFNFNRKLKYVDLSNNKLKQVTFTLTGLKDLQWLDLRNNEIKSLDTASMTRLNEIPRSTDRAPMTRLNEIPRSTDRAPMTRLNEIPRSTDRAPMTTLNDITRAADSSSVGTMVLFQDNRIDCSTCKTQSFIQWIITTPLTDIDSQNLTCVNGNGNQEPINADTSDNVQSICDRETIIITVSVASGILLLIVIILTIVVYKRIQCAHMMQNRTNAINRLRGGDGQYEFVAFLAFSMDDNEFVQHNILHQLDENLQLMTEINRELVSTGDKHFSPGRYVLTETIRCLDTASVVLIVVSNNYCTSPYCRNELDQAYLKGKPIVLMFKEMVDEEMMMPTLKELYRRNVRVLWTLENGEYVLKTTWENVCTSILDLIECDK